MEATERRLLSCLGYAKRQARKLGMDTVHQLVSLSISHAIRAESATRMPRSRQVVSLDAALPSYNDEQHSRAEVGCQTSAEIMTRTQFESIMEDTSAHYMTVLRSMREAIEQRTGVIQSLRAQLHPQ